MEDIRLHGVAQLLVQENLLNKENAFKYYNLALSNHQSFPYYLVINQIIDSKKLALVIAEKFSLPLAELDNFDIESIPTALLSEDFIRHHQMVPLYCKENRLFLAIDDPYKEASFKEIQFFTGFHLNLLIAEADKLQQLITKLLKRKEENDLSHYFSDDIRLNTEEFQAAHEDAPMVKFINEILNVAILKKASDIHFEPYEPYYRIRYRQDGLLNEVGSPPVKLAGRIAARIKVMANLDISEKRLPQDGRFKVKIDKHRAIDIRISTCPTIAGEKIVMRLLDSATTQFDIEALGFNTLQKTLFLKAVHRPQGMILVTGPTGSGKTITLYSALQLLNTLEKNICTVEDPVEIKIPGINQVHINPKAGLTFATTLRAFLRQDPDIIMVGEIRDRETAEIAIKAAQTGHLVLATLHTNNAAETLTRLINMGIPAFNIASSINLIVAQRLVRKRCNHCKTVSQKCNHCSNGYHGRIGIFEVLSLSKDIAHIILSGGNAQHILIQAQEEGMMTMYESGVEKVEAGLTTLDEIDRVITNA